jgi:uncharacterized membrane protein YczE
MMSPWLRVVLLTVVMLGHLGMALWCIQQAPSNPDSYWNEFFAVGFIVMGLGTAIAIIYSIINMPSTTERGVK